MIAELISPLTVWLSDLAIRIPLEGFVLFGSFIEEVIAPIPSPFVMTAAGSIAVGQGRPMIALLWIATLGAVGKVAGSYILYLAADKLEDLLLPRFGRFLGITHAQIERIGKHFSGSWKDILVLTFIRSLPILPSAPVSIACGAIKLRLRTYLIGTTVGTVIRNLFYLYLGYAGLTQSKNLLDGVSSIESIVEILMVIGVACLILWGYGRRKKTLKQTDPAHPPT
jgi:membrane protein DedA with SNARE-associated domain